VPTISRFFGIVIAMYYDDHGHPHFHARHAGEQAKIRVDQVGVIESSLGVRQLRAGAGVGGASSHGAAGELAAGAGG
jgi:Domain of unknown function (DUF4160)